MHQYQSTHFLLVQSHHGTAALHVFKQNQNQNQSGAVCHRHCIGIRKCMRHLEHQAIITPYNEKYTNNINWPTFCSSNANVTPFHIFNQNQNQSRAMMSHYSEVGHHIKHLLLHPTPSSQWHLQIRTCTNTNVRPVRPCMYSTKIKINAQPQPCIILFEFDITWVYDCNQCIKHQTARTTLL